MKHIFSITRNSLLVAGLFFSPVHSQGIQAWIMDNPCKAFVVGAVAAYGVYYGIDYYAEKTAKTRTSKKAKPCVNKVDTDRDIELDLLSDEYTAAIIEDDIFEDTEFQEEDNLFAAIDNNDDIFAEIEQEIIFTEEAEGFVDDIESMDIVFASDVPDYQDFLRSHQDEQGNTFLHDFVSQSIFLTEEESFEQAPEMIVKFYQRLYSDANLTHDEVSEIVGKLTYGHPESKDELYAQLLLLRNNEGKTAKEIAAQGKTEWSKELLKQLEEEEDAVLTYLHAEGVIL